MTLFLQQIVDGLSTGSIYAALALALVLAFRATNVVNFAQGTMGAFGAYLALSLIQFGVVPIAALGIAVVLSIPIGAATEGIVIRRLHGKGELPVVIATVALLILFSGLIVWIWGPGTYDLPWILPAHVYRVGGVAISSQAIENILILIVIVIVMQAVFRWTRWGLAMRAVADNRSSGALLGMPTSGLLMAGWGLAGGLGALAAYMMASRSLLSPHIMDPVLVYALAAAIVGGLTSPIGAVVAGVVIGVAENLAATYIPFIGNDLKILIPLILMGVVLVVRPQGLFGRKEATRV